MIAVAHRFLRRVRPLLNAPYFAGDDTKTRLAELLHAILLIGLLVIVLSSLILFSVVPSLLRMGIINGSVFVIGTGLLLLNKRGHVREAGIGIMSLIVGVIFVDSLFSDQVISPAAGILTLVIAYAGFAFGYRGLLVSALACAATVGIALIIRLGWQPDAAERATLIFQFSVHMVVFLISGLGLSVSVRFLRHAQQRERHSEALLFERNRELEQEIVERRQAEQKQLLTALSMREVIDAAHELLFCETLDDLWRRAVELARERLGIERCGILLTDYETNMAVGTYGTNMQGEVICERSVSFQWHENDIARQRRLPSRGIAEWEMDEAVEHYNHFGENGREVATVGRGWNGKIAIRARKGPAIATFFCDAAITGKPYDPVQMELAAVFCSLLGSIAERKMLTERLTERTHELTQLLDISQTISSTLELNSLLKQLFVKLKAVIDCDGILISEFIDGYHSRIVNCSDEIDHRWIGYVSHLNPANDIHILDLIHTRKPLIIPDVNADTPYARAFCQRIQRAVENIPSEVACAMYVPLVVRDRVIGYMRLTSTHPNHFQSQIAPIALAFATQAAVLIELARSHQEGIKTAALKERSRIARELHDSVSQALYGIVLGVRTSMQYLQANANPQPALDYTLTLSEAALSEIRALIFELRPEYLEKEGLIAAFCKQTEALCMRHQLNVQMNVQTDEPNLSLPAKEAVYRIGLEALQNTLKHAEATQLKITLTVEANTLMLEIQDNGKGFDTNSMFESHYGLSNMRERAAQFGAVLKIASQPNTGTNVSVHMPIQSLI